MKILFSFLGEKVARRFSAEATKYLSLVLIFKTRRAKIEEKKAVKEAPPHFSDKGGDQASATIRH